MKGRLSISISLPLVAHVYLHTYIYTYIRSHFGSMCTCSADRDADAIGKWAIGINSSWVVYTFVDLDCVLLRAVICWHIALRYSATSRSNTAAWVVTYTLRFSSLPYRYRKLTSESLGPHFNKYTGAVHSGTIPVTQHMNIALHTAMYI